MPSSAFSDKKFLIVMIKDGGEDSYNTLISRQPDHVAATRAVRPTLGYTQAELDSTYASSKLAGTAFSLHPSLQRLHALWNAGDMAITHRVGPMFTDISSVPIAELRLAASAFYTGNIQFPFGIGSHDKQAYGTSSMITKEFVDASRTRRFFPGEGFLGRLSSRFGPYTGNAAMPMSIVCGSSQASGFLVSDGLTQPAYIPNVGGDFRRTIQGGGAQINALRRLDTIMNEPRAEKRTEAFRKANLIANDSVEFFQPVIEGAPGTHAVDQDFAGNPTGGWQGIMRTFARAIEADIRDPSLRSRTVFIGGVSNYDNHSLEGKTSGKLAGLHADWAASVANFKSAMVRLGYWNNTVIMDHSEFSRTLRENGSTGTDHAFARDAFAFGGAVRGRGKQGGSGLFGTYPAVLSAVGAGSFDMTGGEAGGGSLAPGISLEQQWDSTLRWFGADSSDIAAIMPRRSTFGGAVGLVA